MYQAIPCLRAAETDAVMPVYTPPSLLLWLPDFFDLGLARFFRQGEAVKYIAGAEGAGELHGEGTAKGWHLAPASAFAFARFF